jgi:hypothetical protein
MNRDFERSSGFYLLYHTVFNALKLAVQEVICCSGKLKLAGFSLSYLPMAKKRISGRKRWFNPCCRKLKNEFAFLKSTWNKVFKACQVKKTSLAEIE